MSLQRITCETTTEGLTHACEPCNRELGRVRGVILFEGDFDFAPLITALKGTSEEAATAIIDAAVEAGKAHIISETTGTFDGGSAQTGDGYGDEETRLLGYLYTLNFNDPSYAENVEFWEIAEKQHWKILWRTETLAHFCEQPATLQAIDPVEADLTSAVVWQVTASWKSKNKPRVAPLEHISKYFEGCWVNG